MADPNQEVNLYYMGGLAPRGQATIRVTSGGDRVFTMPNVPGSSIKVPQHHAKRIIKRHTYEDFQAFTDQPMHLKQAQQISQTALLKQQLEEAQAKLEAVEPRKLTKAELLAMLDAMEDDEPTPVGKVLDKRKNKEETNGNDSQ